MTAVVAHRGAAAEAPENTLPAFALAIALGADALELDVRRTRDGGLVVIHDATLDRTTDRRGAVARLTLRQVREANAGARGAHWERATPRPTTVPTLAEVFERHPGVEITVDVKDPEAAGEVVETIGGHGREERTILYVEEGIRRRAFRHYAGRRATSVAQALRLAQRRRWPDPGDRRVPEVVHTPLRARGRTIVTSAFVTRARRAARAVQVWTVNDPATMTWLAELGVTGIITDDVRRAVNRLREGKR